MRAIILLATAAAIAAPAAATAQGAFNMGGLTGTLSQDAVTQSEERRATRQAPRSRAQARREFVEECSVRGYFSAEVRRLPRMQAFDRRCRAAGL